jgi:hypothetical protein
MFTAGKGEQAEGSVCTVSAGQRGRAGAGPSRLKPLIAILSSGNYLSRGRVCEFKVEQSKAGYAHARRMCSPEGNCPLLPSLCIAIPPHPNSSDSSPRSGAVGKSMQVAGCQYHSGVFNMDKGT